MARDLFHRAVRVKLNMKKTVKAVKLLTLPKHNTFYKSCIVKLMKTQQLFPQKIDTPPSLCQCGEELNAVNEMPHILEVPSPPETPPLPVTINTVPYILWNKELTCSIMPQTALFFCNK